MSFLAVELVANPIVPVQTTGRVGAGGSWGESPSFLVLSLPLQPLCDHLAGGPLPSQALEPGQRHPGSAALHSVAVTPATGLMHCNIGRAFKAELLRANLEIFRREKNRTF